MKDTDNQLKELFDELESEEQKDKKELEELRNLRYEINFLMNFYHIPTKSKDGKELSLLERLSIALKREVA